MLHLNKDCFIKGFSSSGEASVCQIPLIILLSHCRELILAVFYSIQILSNLNNQIINQTRVTPPLSLPLVPSTPAFNKLCGNHEPFICWASLTGFP